MRISQDYKVKFNNMKDKKIDILAYPKGEKSSGGTIVKNFYVLHKSIWANYRSMSGSEYFNNLGMVDTYEQQVIFTINYHKDIEQGMYIIFKEKVYEIIYVDDLEGYKKDMKLTCINNTLKDIGAEFKEFI